MYCHKCERPIECSIEGVSVCSRCWTKGQLTEIEKEVKKLTKDVLEEIAGDTLFFCHCGSDLVDTGMIEDCNCMVCSSKSDNWWG